MTMRGTVLDCATMIRSEIARFSVNVEAKFVEIDMLPLSKPHYGGDAQICPTIGFPGLVKVEVCLCCAESSS